MSAIHVLSQDTINKIAAGEVIERPMAVVKELLENAIDADASSITVEIKDGGKSLIRITDNGTGIQEEDIRLAFTPHATSKILSINDLMRVSTLGFRGEALASIASVSQLEMVTKTRDSLMGSRYLTDGGQEKSLEAVGCPEGTTFIVRNLFYNTPARLKFLKTSQTEAGYINTLMEHMALSHPEIAFRFISQNQTKLHTSGNGNVKDVIFHIYGRQITENLLEVNVDTEDCKVEGYIGKPVVSRGNRNYMNYFINGRYIKSPVVYRAIEEAYQPYTMQHRYPFTVLHFSIEQDQIDVNVHPQKMELRFMKEPEVYQSIYHALSEALKHKELIPEVTLSEPEKQEKKDASTRQRPPEPFEVQRQREEIKQEPQQQNTPQEIADSAEVPLHQNTPREVVVGATELLHQNTPQDRTVGMSEPQQKQENRTDVGKTARQEAGDRLYESASYGNKAAEAARNLHDSSQETLFEEGILSRSAEAEVTIIGQVFQTYWILQYQDSMYLVDQHAAHEKVLYERFMKSLREKEPLTQMLQPPIILTLSMQEEQAVQEHHEIFEKLGYQIEHFGGREYAVSGIPAHLPDIGEEELLKEIIDTLVESHVHAAPEILLDRVASMSCKAAVKGNNRLPLAQMQELLRELMTLEKPYHCPHGRPTMIKMTKTELDRKFKRIV